MAGYFRALTEYCYCMVYFNQYERYTNAFAAVPTAYIAVGVFRLFT